MSNTTENCNGFEIYFKKLKRKSFYLLLAKIMFKHFLFKKKHVLFHTSIVSYGFSSNYSDDFIPESKRHAFKLY